MNKDKKNKNVVPKLRFEEFEKSSFYKKFVFTDIFQFSTGKNIKQKEASPKFKIPCVRYGELYHMYDEVISVVINKTNLNKSELLFSHGDEILLPSAGEDPLDIGSASALTIKNIAIGRTINILRPIKDGLYSHIYISYYINEKLKRKISTLARGSSISNVYNSDLKKLEIILPALAEQEKVANCLTSLDKLIDLETKALEILQKHKKGLLQQLFPQEGEKEPKLRFPEFKNNGNWFIKELSNLIIAESSNLAKSKLVLVENGYPVYGANGKLGNINFYKQSEDYISIVKDGSGVGNLSLNRGKSSLLGTLNYLLLKNKAKYSLTWVYYLLHTINFTPFIKGSGIPHIYYKDYSKLLVRVPPLSEQKKIANCLFSLDNQIIIQDEKIEILRIHKKGLMQQLFPNINT